MLMMAKMHALQSQLVGAEGPSLRSVATISNATQNQNVSAPAGQLAGDFLLLVVGNINANSFTTPAGWTLVPGGTFGVSAGFFVYYKTATSDNEAVTLNSFGPSSRTISYAAFKNVTGVDVGTRTNMTSAASSITIASVTATAPGMRVTASMVDRDDATLSSGPTDMTQVTLAESPNLGLGLWTKSNEPSGASATATVTWSSTADKAGVQFHLY